MKKWIPIVLILFISEAGVFSQQVENSGFEDWENAGTVIDEPVNWSSIKTSDNSSLNGVAPVIWGQSTDAHSGDFSVKLINVSVLGIVATGTITNGRVHSDFDPELGYVYTNESDERWNTPFTIRADSLIGWYKFFPVGQDFGRAQALLHVDYAKIPEKVDSSNWIGKAEFVMQSGQTVDTWTRFSVPFVYYDDRTPEYILFVLTAGNKTTPVEDSWVLYDDIATVGEHQSVEDNSFTEGTIYFSDNTLHLDRLPVDFLKDAKIEIYDMMGRNLWQVPVSSATISLKSVPVDKGIYIVKFNSDLGIVSSKVFLQ
jgi:hypothetical protein